jgi:hypothetical protein
MDKGLDLWKTYQSHTKVQSNLPPIFKETVSMNLGNITGTVLIHKNYKQLYSNV